MKKRIIGLVIFAMLWLGIGVSDYARVSDFEKPVFCIPTQTADDGGSGTYRGLGYRYEIEGNFMPEEEYPGVTRYEMYVFGRQVRIGCRD